MTAPKIQTTAQPNSQWLHSCIEQRAKKVMSDSLRLVDFPVRLVDSVLHLPDGQVKFLGKIFEEIQITQSSTIRDEIVGD